MKDPYPEKRRAWGKLLAATAVMALVGPMVAGALREARGGWPRTECTEGWGCGCPTRRFYAWGF